MSDSVDSTPNSDYSLRGNGEMRLINRAIRNGWNIPEKYKEGIVQTLVQRALDKDSTPRDSNSAARVLATMNGQNIKLTEFMTKDTTPEVPEMQGEFKDVIDSMPLEDKLELKRLIDKQQIPSE